VPHPADGGRLSVCAVAWLLGGQCLSLADYVAVTAPTGEAVAAGCR